MAKNTTTDIEQVGGVVAPAYTLNNAASLKALAEELSQLVKDKGMTTNIQGKNYVHVEAWTFAGVSIGLLPVVVSCDDISRPGHMVGMKGQERQEIRYKATVELLNVHTNQVVGRAFATCSNEEAKKKFFDEYSIASMAQTRATGKVYRLPLGWLMQVAGFQATPAEEMDNVVTLPQAIGEVFLADTEEEVDALWSAYPSHQNASAFVKVVKGRKKQLAQPAA
ncbi:hypothetical protein GCM10027048_28050 [Hymenobacter coalescens]